jgi:hypothetical protein
MVPVKVYGNISHIIRQYFSQKRALLPYGESLLVLGVFYFNDIGQVAELAVYVHAVSG